MLSPHCGALEYKQATFPSFALQLALLSAGLAREISKWRKFDFIVEFIKVAVIHNLCTPQSRGS